MWTAHRPSQRLVQCEGLAVGVGFGSVGKAESQTFEKASPMPRPCMSYQAEAALGP
jgi:hypothetical protein